MSRRRVPRAPSGSDVVPLRRRYASSLAPEAALALVARLEDARRIPSVRAAAERDLAILRLVAELGLGGYWLASLRWGDVRIGDCRAIRLRGAGGIECHLTVSDALLAALAAWRSRLGERVGRTIEDDAPLFPAIGHGLRAWGPERALRPTSAAYFQQIVRRRLLEAGADPGAASIRVLRGALCPNRLPAPDERRAA